MGGRLPQARGAAIRHYFSFISPQGLGLTPHQLRRSLISQRTNRTAAYSPGMIIAVFAR